MATNERTSNGVAAGSRVKTKKMTAQQREAKKKRRIILFAVEVVIILVMLAVLYLVLNATSGSEGMTLTVLDSGSVSIDPTVQAQATDESGAMYGYMNIALFGVDAKTENELFKSSRSDSIMVASINMDTGEIKLVSVYRDSYLNRGNDTYNKCNGAYALGGAEQAVKMLNMNLDLNITDFVTVGYAGLAEVIDGLGGVWIDVDEQELRHINNYQYSILGKLGRQYTNATLEEWAASDLNYTPDEYFQNYDVKPVKEAGYQLLNGLQATAYCRIRYVGNDFQRTERQREVIKAIEAQAKQADLTTLTRVFNSASDDIYTSLSADRILELLPLIGSYKIVDESEFPGRDMRMTVSMGAKGSCEVPSDANGNVDLEAGVVELHKFLFGDENYQISDTVKEINRQIKADTSKYLGGG